VSTKEKEFFFFFFGNFFPFLFVFDNAHTVVQEKTDEQRDSQCTLPNEMMFGLQMHATRERIDKERFHMTENFRYKK